MRKKPTIIIVSTLVAILLMSSGYALWQENLYVEGKIKIVPDPKVLASMESKLARLEQELDDEIEKQRIAEENRVKAEAQALLDAQKKLEEAEVLKLQLEQSNLEEVNSTVSPPTMELRNETSSDEKRVKDEIVVPIVEEKEKDIEEAIEMEEKENDVKEEIKTENIDTDIKEEADSSTKVNTEKIQVDESNE